MTSPIRNSRSSRDSRDSLEAWRVRLEDAGSARQRRALALELGRDPRAGAQRLAQRVLDEDRARRRERARLGRRLALRNRLLRGGARLVAGVDEVGVGPLAGPLVAAAVILPPRIDADALSGLDDSKKLGATARERLAASIHACALAVSIGSVSPREIDAMNVYHAGHEALRRAVAGLALPPDHVLVDARTIPRIDAAQTPIVGGDGRDASIAAASIVAKVHRDRLMQRVARRHPGYGFERHVGYATREHLDALARRGPTPVHRCSFAPVARAIR